MAVLTADNESEKVDGFSLKDMLTIFIGDIGEKISLALNNENQDIEMLLHMIYMGKINQSSPPRSKGIIVNPMAERRSSAKDEWYTSLQDIIVTEPHNMPVLQKMYESNQMSFWTNEDDFSFFNYEAEHQGRRFRVIFYNSTTYDYIRLITVKVPFEELVKKNEAVRICWY